jgi:hypothetical protein
MKLLALSLITLLTIQGIYAATPPPSSEETDKIVAADRARWANIKVINYKYGQPPSAWKSAHDPNAHFSLSFPCEPQVQSGKQYVYSCAVNKISYSAVMEQGNFREPNNVELFGAGNTYSTQKRLLAAFGAPVTITPIIAVNYAGAAGRQQVIISNGLTIEVRFLCKPDMCVQMTVAAATGKLPKDNGTFFNSLQFDQ